MFFGRCNLFLGRRNLFFRRRNLAAGLAPGGLFAGGLFAGVSLSSAPAVNDSWRLFASFSGGMRPAARPTSASSVETFERCDDVAAARSSRGCESNFCQQTKRLSVSSRGSSCSCVSARGWSRSSTRCSTFSGTRSRSRGFLTMILRQFVFACGSRWATLCTRGSVEDNSPFSSRERTSWHFTVMQDYKFSFRSTPSTLSTLNSQLFFVSGEVRT